MKVKLIYVHSMAELASVSLLMPDPCGADDLVELRVFRLPTELADGFLRTGDQDCRITGASGMDFGRNWMAGDAAGRLDDLADAETPAVPKVEDEPIMRLECIEGEKVRVGKVGDVDVVANTGAVRCGVVVTVNSDGLAAA